MSKRTVKPSRQQLVVVIADDSASMKGEKAKAAVEGVRNMILECQTRAGGEDSLYRVSLILFGDNARLHPLCKRTPVLEIDTEQIDFHGGSHGTNIGAALQLAYDQISEYLKEIEEHPERSKHPLPLVIMFSDGHNNDAYGRPELQADKLKGLKYDGDSILIMTAGVAVDPSDQPDEVTLKAIASTEDSITLYVPVRKASVLTNLLAAAGSSAASTVKEVYDAIRSVINEA